MIYFVIPLRGKAASRDWKGVTWNFNRTLESCYNQTSPEFKVLVACHDVPKLDQAYDDRVEFIQVSIPTPTNFEAMMFDKGYKMHTLMYEACKRLINLNSGGGTSFLLMPTTSLATA